MDNDEDRRRFHRILFHTATELQQGDMVSTCELLDVSLKGLLLKAPEDLQIDASHPLQARIQLTDDALILMSLSLAWQKGDQLGLVCESIDLDSMCHLRRLIELNLCDPEAAARDLSQLAALTPRDSLSV